MLHLFHEKLIYLNFKIVNSVFQPGYPNPTFTLKIRKLVSSNQTVTLKPPTDFRDM